MEFIKSFYIRIRNKLIIFDRKRRSFVELRIKNKIPRLVLHEKYEKIVKWLLRFLATIGIISSAISLPWPKNLILAVFLFLIEQLLEKTIFLYTTAFIQPIPEWDPEELLGMIFKIPVKQGEFDVGMLLKNDDYARKLSRCIRAWNYDGNKDEKDNIKISFIIEENSEYSLYLYPSLYRKSLKAAREQFEKELFREKFGKEHRQLVFSMMICKVFPNPPNSSFNLFRSKYKSGTPFRFTVYVKNPQTPPLEAGKPVFLKEEQIEEVSDIGSVIKYHLKIKNRSELTEQDQEYDHGRLIMNK